MSVRGTACTTLDVTDAASAGASSLRQLGATPFLADMLRAPNLAEGDISSFRIFVCGGAPIPRPLAEEASRRLPCRLVPVWGMTENSAVTAVLPSDPVEKIVSTDGQAFPGMEVTVGDETGTPLPKGQEGDLYARGLPVRWLCAGLAIYRAVLHTRWLVRDGRPGGDGCDGVHSHHRPK